MTPTTLLRPKPCTACGDLFQPAKVTQTRCPLCPPLYIGIPETGVKTCRLCGETKPWEEFNLCSNNRTDGRTGRCKVCARAASREWSRQNREKVRARTRTWQTENPERMGMLRYSGRLWRQYGMTLAQYEARLREQGGGCAICGGQPSKGRTYFCVDHDHNCCAGTKSCGKCVRGLLCNRCNDGIARFHDSPETLRRAIAYLGGSF